MNIMIIINKIFTVNFWLMCEVWFLADKLHLSKHTALPSSYRLIRLQFCSDYGSYQHFERLDVEIEAIRESFIISRKCLQ